MKMNTMTRSVWSGVAAVALIGAACGQLPPGFEVVPCIVADGTQYLDTGYTPTSTNMGFYLDFQYGGVVSTSATADYEYVLGSSCKNGGGWGGLAMSGYGARTGGQFSFCYQMPKLENRLFIDPGLVAGARMTLELKSARYVTSTGQDVMLEPVTAGQFCGSVYLGSIHSDNAVSTNRWLKGRIYRLKFYEGDETVHDFVPVRTVGGLVGLYDVRGNLGFRTSATASPYMVGTETVRLLEYIEATGTQYVNTGYTPTGTNVGFYLDFRYDNEIATSGHAQVLGSSQRNGGQWGGLVLNGYRSCPGGQILFGQQDGVKDPGLVKGERMQLELKNCHYVSSSGTDITFHPASWLFCGAVYLGKIHYEDSPANTMSGRYYRFKLYKGDAVVRDYRPALQLADGVAGFFEALSGTFVPSASATPFVAGPSLCTVEVASSRPGVGTVSTGYVTGEMATGTVFQCTADPYWTNDVLGVRYACLGWTLKDASGTCVAATNALTFNMNVSTNAGLTLEWNWVPCQLPEGYRLLESITSTGTQVADLGVTPVKVTRVVYDFKFAEVPSSSTRSLSGWGSSGAKDAFTWGHMENKGCPGYFSSSVGSNWVFQSTGVLLDGARHVFDLQDGVQCFDGVVYGNSRTAPTPVKDNSTVHQHLYAAGLHSGWNDPSHQYGIITAQMKSVIYGCRIYEGHVLVADFVPCEDTAGSVAGLYDVCTGTFAASMVADTAFSAGPAAKVRPPLPPRGSMVLIR